MTDKNDMNAQDVLKKYDREANTVHYAGWPKKIVAAIAITFSVFQLYTATFGVLDAQLQRAVHLGFGLALAYLLYPFRRAWTRDSFFHPIDVLFAVLGAAAPAYIVIQYRELVTRAGSVTTTDAIVGGIGILLVIEATRRVVGLPMVTVVLFFLAYAFLGPYMPGVLAHRGLTLEQLVSHLYFTTEGIFGIPLGVSSTFIFLFILFGAYLESTGLGKFFIDLANAVAGWASGGPAKVAVLSSGLMGTVSGSSVANVVGTGSLTIPMMKKLGYHTNFAGAVEAAASTGGQLMPPVMGAAAFLMAEFVGVPYIDVVKAAAIPALLYFTGVWLGVHFEAKRKNLKGIPRSELPNALHLLKERGHLALPLIVIVYLLVSGYTPMRAALVAIVLSIVCAMLRRSTRMNPIEIVYGLERGAQAVLGGHHHRRCHQDRRWSSSGLRAHRVCRRHAAPRDVLHHDYGDCTWHGCSHDGELRHHIDDCRARACAAWRACSGGTYVCVLLWHHRRCDAARCARGLCRRGHQRGESAAHGRTRLETRRCGIHHPLYFRTLARYFDGRCNAALPHLSDTLGTVRDGCCQRRPLRISRGRLQGI